MVALLCNVLTISQIVETPRQYWEVCRGYRAYSPEKKYGLHIEDRGTWLYDIWWKKAHVRRAMVTTTIAKDIGNLSFWPFILSLKQCHYDGRRNELRWQTPRMQCEVTRKSPWLRITHRLCIFRQKKKHPMFGIERVSYSILTKSVWFNHIILYSALVSVMIPLVFGSSNVWLNKRNKFFRMIRMTSQSWFRPLPAGKVNGKINYYDALVCCAANDGDPATKCNVHSAVGWTLEICFGYAWNPDLATSNFGLLYPSPEWIFAVMQPNVDIDMLRGFREEKRDTSKSYRRTNTMFQSIKNIGNRTVATLAILWLNVSCWNFRI